MKHDQVITNPGAGSGSNPEFLNALEGIHVEEQTPLELAEQLLEHRRINLLLRMTARRFAELSHTEKRNYRRWAEHFERVFAEKANLIRRNSKPDIDTPASLQAGG